ncbi:MAG: hypothetical protein JWR06_2969, partial [Jatrophihabitans sp.]|nr:hypothetical protein [Jatrophihabitans sp.]
MWYMQGESAARDGSVQEPESALRGRPTPFRRIEASASASPDEGRHAAPDEAGTAGFAPLRFPVASTFPPPPPPPPLAGPARLEPPGAAPDFSVPVITRAADAPP